ncbi:xanthine dehydrogenase-like isoform X2 [Hyposmocoma kahamanoa]|uniref:xanthine dehydrogenase-like isoform X2 n=1 Tax=Hyposmocoma kahamanoa TaxID=1477025 RepID=UPI000E6D7B01|nr:xanthine dehydrogenase-like isoform X2 [Hyposmocoma kahamanoa]
MDKITFSVNGKKCEVGGDVDSDVSLNDYIRERLNLRGTKYMCKEGGCGACIVAVSTADDTAPRVFSVNSCLVSVTSCHGWQVTTVEGLGDRRRGYHPLQRALAEHNGSQCGYCSPGWVMAMYGLLESSDYNLTQRQIENSFGSNVCRCTGFRPILDAFKTFAKDAPKPNEYVTDIEDLTCRRGGGDCTGDCRDWCIVQKPNDEAKIIKIKLKDNRIWYRVKEVKDIFAILEQEGDDSYMLVNGNTGKGAVPVFDFPRVLIDIQPVEELKGYYVDQNLVVGAGSTLTNFMDIMLTVAHQEEEFGYLLKLHEHLDLVAHIPVRNIGTIAGNLMLKHRQPTFSSDVYLLLESTGAVLTIASKESVTEVLPEQFLHLNMTGKVITHVKLPPLSHNYEFVSFKVMPRSQNAHASVNAAFLYQFDPHRPNEVVSARIVFGGLSAYFTHASHTEQLLIGQNLFTNKVLQEALHTLELELKVENIAGELTPEYRKKCALGLFYKGLLTIIPQQSLKPWYRSGVSDLRKSRPLSKGTEVYDTNPDIWPINEPMPKVDALIQCAGEAKYVNDLPTQQDEVFCAFVTSDIGTGVIEEIDPSPALKLPGVIAFFSAKDIPGINSFVSLKQAGASANEELFADKIVKFYDQPLGIVVADSEKLANRAALLVRVKYRQDKHGPLLTINEIREQDPSRVNLYVAIPARDRGSNVRKVISDCHNLYWQYHYSMETLACVTRPSDDGIDVFPATQFPSWTHLSISDLLNIPQNRINLEVSRCGGAYGNKISRGHQVTVACALTTYLLNRPCRFVSSIQSTLRSTGKRNPSTRDFEVGVNDLGEIQYLEYHYYADNGYVVNEPLIGFAGPAIRSCYDSRRWSIKTFNVTTDTPSNSFCRAPALTEYIMEQISYVLDKDPLEVRLNNLSPNAPEVNEMIQTLVKDAEYEKRKKEVKEFNQLNRWKKRGLRVALMRWPAGVIVDYLVTISIYHGDGSLVVKHGGVDIGQGKNTKVIQVIAYTLNIKTDKVKVKPTDVASNPNTSVTGGSTSTGAVCFGAVKCCQIILDRLAALREELNNPTWEELILNAYLRGINLQASYRVTPNDITIHRSGGAAFAEVELDILTGEHEIRRVDIIEDVGTSLNPEIDIGQIEGGFVMGVGYWTSEHQIVAPSGEVLTDRTWNYHVPLAKDIPIDFRVQLRRNSFNPTGVIGAKAVGEPPTTMAVCVAFALREAIAASREDSGIPQTQWFNVDGPYTLEANVLKANAHLEEFLFN